MNRRSFLTENVMVHFKRIAALLCWILTNDLDLSFFKGRKKYFEDLVEMKYGVSRTAELRKFAEEEFKETTAALKEANERLDKLLALALLAIGWVAAQSGNAFMPIAITLLLVSALLILCGRWRMTSRFPASFPDFVDLALDSGKEETPKFEFDVARQYHRASYDNQLLTRLTHFRLLLGAISFVAGLIAFALRK